MRYCILKTGRATRVTRDRLGDYDALFLRLLAEPGQHWDVLDLERGRFPSTLEGYDGLVITGSAASAYDDTPWVKKLLELIRTAHSAEIPLLAICFGLQAVALALGGQVALNPRGWELGLVKLQPTEAGRRFPQLSGAQWPLSILEMHQDIATVLPPGAVSLASSTHTPHEIFTVGDRTLCLQGHPEMDKDVILDLIEKREQRGVIDPQRAEQGRRSLGSSPDGRSQNGSSEHEGTDPDGFLDAGLQEGGSPDHEFIQGWLKRFLKEGRISDAA